MATPFQIPSTLSSFLIILPAFKNSMNFCNDYLGLPYVLFPPDMSSFKTLNFIQVVFFKYVKMAGLFTFHFFSNVLSFVDSCHSSWCKMASGGTSVESKVCCSKVSDSVVHK